MRRSSCSSRDDRAGAVLCAPVIVKARNPLADLNHAAAGPAWVRTCLVADPYQQEDVEMIGKSALMMAVAGLALGTLAAVTPARADVGVKVGVLTCDVDPGWGFVVGSSRQLRCTYAAGNRVEHYSGSISKIGVDIGYLQGGEIVWGVFAPTVNVPEGALAGAYGGATGGASIGVGADANVLIGGSTRSLALQPVSFEGDKGFDVAAGIASLSLTYQG
jgi:hypothetical protein